MRILSSIAKHNTNVLLLAASTAAIGEYIISDKTDRANACGIIGVVGTKPNANAVLLEGLTILQNRGYDSAGLCTLRKLESSNSTDFVTTKYANSNQSMLSANGNENCNDGDSISRLRRASEFHQNHMTGIAHTRWATQGSKIDANAHPHYDARNSIAVVHNGSLLNSHEIRKRLEKQGITFRSQTDTEVLAQLIGHYYNSSDGKLKELSDKDSSGLLLEATKRALGELHGTFGVAVLCKDSPDQMIVAQHGSPMVLGIGKGQMYASSEVAAFRRHTENIVELQDGEIAVIRADSTEHSFDRSRVRAANQKTFEHPDTPAPYPHWTLREIEEQPDAIYRALNFGGRMTQRGVTMGGLAMRRTDMLEIQHLKIVACGSSLNAGHYGERLMRWLKAFSSVSTIDAASFSPNLLPRCEGGLLAVSQSGETKIVLDAILQGQDLNVPCFSVVNGVGSRIATTTKIGAYQNAGPEIAVTSTKSFSTQVTVIALISCWFAQHRSSRSSESKQVQLTQALQRLPLSFKSALATRDDCKQVAKMLEKADNCFIVGQGMASAIAAEGAQKLKEQAYLHARSLAGSENDISMGLLDNTTNSLESKNTNESSKKVPFIFLLMNDDEEKHELQKFAAKLHQNGHPVVVISDNPKLGANISCHQIAIQDTGPLTALVAITPLQLIAYELSLLRGLNPDAPRNVAKIVKD